MGRQLRHGIALGICSLFSSTAAALLLLHCCDWLYRWDIAALRISEATGLSQQVILRNYHAMMDYLWPLSEGAFSLPDLPFSAQGALHFADCRRLFAIVYLVGIAAAVGLLWLWRRRRRDPVDKRAFLIACCCRNSFSSTAPGCSPCFGRSARCFWLSPGEKEKSTGCGSQNETAFLVELGISVKNNP